MHKLKFAQVTAALLLTPALMLAGCDREAKVDADILAAANRPAEEPQASSQSPYASNGSLSAEELALEPESVIEPLTGDEAARQAYRELSWDDLIPADFDFSFLQDQINLDDYDIMSMADDDPEAQRLYADLINILADVPFVETLDGQEGRIPGFLVPLEFESTAIKEFFLVPYFGACIHTPPPPANQIVHVVLDEAIAFSNIYEPYWIEGSMTVTKTETDLGTAGYRMQATKISLYD